MLFSFPITLQQLYMSSVSITCVGGKADGSFVLKKASTTFGALGRCPQA